LVALVFLFGLSCSGKKNEGPKDQALPNQGLASVEKTQAGNQAEKTQESALSAGDWEEAFKFVRDGIRTEPSTFPLKTPAGVRWGRSGNSLEKALLLAELLEDNGETVRIAEGELDDRTAAALVGSLFPAGKEFSYKKDVPVSSPVDDPALIRAVKRHFWVKMKDGDRWIDLDPSFPGADPGKTYARTQNVIDLSDEALKTRASIVLAYTAPDSGETQTVLSWEGDFEEVANRAVSLTVVAEFRKETEEKEEEEAEGAAGVFGALGGQSSKKKKGRTEKVVSYNAALSADADRLADGAFSPEKGKIKRLILKIRFESRGAVISESERVLFEETESQAEAPLFQRHAILIAPNKIPAEAWQDRLNALSNKEMLAEVKAQVEEVKKSLKSKKFGRKTLEKSAALEQKLGPEVGHLLNLIFASTSDDQTEQEGNALSISTYYQIPRILITSFSGSQEKLVTSFDLRQDRVEAVPLPGQALSMKRAFLYGRGVIESILEGKLLELLTARPALTTASLMRKAAENGIPIRTYSSLERDLVAELAPLESVARKIFTALDSGRVVAIPEKSVDWEGQERWGWWDIDPITMETIGVMDTGLHQAVLERTILETEGPLETEMGYVIGAMVGAIDTYWVLSAMVLKYGELNRAALEEAKAYMKEIDAVMCPGFEAKLSFTVAELEDCFSIGLEAGAEIKQGWCDNFATGFACASTIILNYYLSQLEE